MANKTMDLDFDVPGYDKKPKGPLKKFSKKFNRIFLIASAGVLIVALAVAAILLLTGPPQSAIVILDFNTAIKGVSIGGTDISNMTRDQALEATAQLQTDMLAAAKISLSVNGQIYEFDPSALSITTDYTNVINEAMNYGHEGTIDERAADAGAPKNFDIKYTVDENALNTALANLKAGLDKAPQDAGVIFAPWGYTANADGTFTPYTPDLPTIINICKTYAKKNEYAFPERVRIPDEEMPIAARYEFWKGGKYVADFKPADANISRFIYTPEVTGLVADTSQVADDIKAQVESGSFTTITVPVQVTEPTLKLADIKNDTQLIASWSSYWGGSHDGYDRNYNVSMISSLINDGGISQPGSGSILQPGAEWSVNQTVGYREDRANISKYGWRKAAGIENGGYTAQYGGGVCQLGSTTYNAAIRAGLFIVKSVHHTIPSDYVPIGLDATLSSNKSLDLILRNDNTMPYYIVSYINPKDRYVTVEIYGPPLIDKDHPEWGNVIYNFTSKNKGRYGDPQYKTVYCNFVEKEAPDGTLINAGKTEYEFAKNRQGTRAQTYKHIYDLTGKLLWEGNFLPQYSYPIINGTMYYWGTEADPHGDLLTPSESPSTEPSTDPSVAP